MSGGVFNLQLNKILLVLFAENIPSSGLYDRRAYGCGLKKQNMSRIIAYFEGKVNGIIPILTTNFLKLEILAIDETAQIDADSENRFVQDHIPTT